MSTSRGAIVTLLGAVACVGCMRSASLEREAPLRADDAATTTTAVAPAALTKIRTTGAELALGNLDAQIVGREKMIQRDANDVKATRGLVDLLLARGQYASRIADYERADALASALVAAHPDDADAHLAYASTLGTFHRFARELEELDLAERAKASSAATATSRASVLIAQGRYDDADALGVWKNTDSLDTMGLTSAAVLAGERGDAAESERLFEAARAKYRDVSPFPVAWMDFQRGAFLERQGDRARAKLYFAEAHAALPGFGHPAVHLAGLETPASALAILEPLVGKADDPQVDAAYADALRRLGRTAEASAPIARAKARYVALVEQHPEAFGDHAAQFYLGLGHDTQRALVLARENAENRPTEPALDLWLTAALAAGSHDDACAAATEGSTLRHFTGPFRATIATTRATCGK